MRRLVKRLVMASLICACGFALASAAPPQDVDKEHSMTGCLKTDGTAPKTYRITDPDKGATSVSIVFSKVNLAPHLGHKIEVTGTDVPAKDAEWASNVPKAPLYMKVTSIKMISASCP